MSSGAAVDVRATITRWSGVPSETTSGARSGPSAGGVATVTMSDSPDNSPRIACSGTPEVSGTATARRYDGCQPAPVANVVEAE